MRAQKVLIAAVFAVLVMGSAAWSDSDHDGVKDDDDYCDDTPRHTAVNEYGCSKRQLDADGDGICDPDRPRYDDGPHEGHYMPVYRNWCVGLDNCKHVPNPEQTRTHGHRSWRGDACFREGCHRSCRVGCDPVQAGLPDLDRSDPRVCTSAGVVGDLDDDHRCNWPYRPISDSEFGCRRRRRHHNGGGTDDDDGDDDDHDDDTTTSGDDTHDDSTTEDDGTSHEGTSGGGSTPSGSTGGGSTGSTPGGSTSSTPAGSTDASGTASTVGSTGSSGDSDGYTGGTDSTSGAGSSTSGGSGTGSTAASDSSELVGSTSGSGTIHDASSASGTSSTPGSADGGSGGGGGGGGASGGGGGGSTPGTGSSTGPASSLDSSAHTGGSGDGSTSAAQAHSGSHGDNLVTDGPSSNDGSNSVSATTLIAAAGGVAAVLIAIAAMVAVRMYKRRQLGAGARALPPSTQPSPRSNLGLAALPDLVDERMRPVSNMWDTGVNTLTDKQVSNVVALPDEERPTVFAGQSISSLEAAGFLPQEKPNPVFEI